MAHVQLAATIQQVFEYLQYNAGTPCTLDDICNMVGCPREQARTALETLAGTGHIARHQQLDGAVAYSVTSMATFSPHCIVF